MEKQRLINQHWATRLFIVLMSATLMKPIEWNHWIMSWRSHSPRNALRPTWLTRVNESVLGFLKAVSIASRLFRNLPARKTAQGGEINGAKGRRKKAATGA